MAKQKLIYFPFPTSKGYGNPYSDNFKQSLLDFYDVEDMEYKNHALQSLSLLKRSFYGEVFVFNWIENVKGWSLWFLQYLLVRLAFFILKLRKVKIVWTFHNIHPHNGDNIISQSIQKFFFKNATLIITHSKQALKYAQSHSIVPVKYICHPVSNINIPDEDIEVEDCDILIWGNILPYKGVPEFVESPLINSSNLRIRIIGTCSDPSIINRILSHCSNLITYENRRIDFAELKTTIQHAKFVVFPYIGDCVSSSGALIDTVALGGKILGPNVGAFSDLEELKVCKTYKNFDDLINIISLSHYDNNYDFDIFCKENSWTNFGKSFINWLE